MTPEQTDTGSNELVLTSCFPSSLLVISVLFSSSAPPPILKSFLPLIRLQADCPLTPLGLESLLGLLQLLMLSSTLPEPNRCLLLHKIQICFQSHSWCRSTYKNDVNIYMCQKKTSSSVDQSNSLSGWLFDVNDLELKCVAHPGSNFADQINVWGDAGR